MSEGKKTALLDESKSSNGDPKNEGLIKCELPVKDIYTIFYSELFKTGFSSIYFIGMLLSLTI